MEFTRVGPSRTTYTHGTVLTSLTSIVQTSPAKRDHFLPTVGYVPHILRPEPVHFRTVPRNGPFDDDSE